MLSVDDALAICRAIAAQSGEQTDGLVEMRAAAVERLLVEVQLAHDEADHYRNELIKWGIPAKRRTVERREKGGFEYGWE